MSVTGTRSPRMAALITGLVLGGTALSYVPANAAPQLGAAPVVRAATVTPTTVVKRLSENKGPSGGNTHVVLVLGKDLAVAGVDGNGDPTLTPKDVLFGEVEATVVSALSVDVLQVTVPPAAAGTTAVQVKVGDATKGPKYTYEYTEANATILQTALDGWAPVSETGLLDRVITGTGFDKTTAVLVGGKRAKVTPTPKGTVFDTTKIEFDFPTGLVGVQDVVVSDKRGSDLVGYVTYTPKTITATAADLPYAVVEGPTAIPVTGTNLDAVTTATYANADDSVVQKATVKRVNATKVVVTVPAGVAVTGGTLTLKGAYGNSDELSLDRQAAGTPTVTEVYGAKQAGGVVTLQGTNLVSLKAVKVTSTLSGVDKVVSGSAITVLSPTKATVKLPALVKDATYSVVVTTAHSAASAAYTFDLEDVAPPSVDTVSLAAGVVSITGTDLTGATQVSFQVGTDPAVVVLAAAFSAPATATAISLTPSPALASGTHAVVVTTPGGTSTPVNLVVP